MELPRRSQEDRFLQDGDFRRAVQRLQQCTEAHELRIAIVYAFDFRTRMLPYWYADKRMAPCSVRTVGDVLHACGFKHLRIVLQQWTPYFQPSAARLDGRRLDMLLVSAMQVHAEAAYEMVRNAYRMKGQRPLILAGGPKAIYEPTDYLELGPEPGMGADCVVTGEAFVLLDLLERIIEHRHEGEPVLESYNRAWRSGALERVPGLVYRSPKASAEGPVAINTGVQRLLRDLDEMPMPDAGYRMLESPHRRKGLMPKPFPADQVGRKSQIASIISTQGCKFNCSYCPIPAVNQRTWRHKSPQRFAAEIKHIRENFGISTFFSTDDNFFNNRQTVIDLMSELGRTEIAGGPAGTRIRFYTEGTQFDVHKNQDILKMCRTSGLRGIWFGIEDITAELVNKGQDAGKTAQLFSLLHGHGIMPMAMMIHSDDQPLYSKRGDLSGLLNQARYLFNAGAVSYQCTYLGPAPGTRNWEPALKSGEVFERVAGRPVPQAYQDGNHVVSSHHPKPWQKQLNLALTYLCFYNPINTVRSLLRLKKNSVSAKVSVFQIIGQVGLFYTIPRMLWWAFQLRRGPIRKAQGVEPPLIPMIDPVTGEQVNWASDQPKVMPSPRAGEDGRNGDRSRSAHDRTNSLRKLPILTPSS